MIPNNQAQPTGRFTIVTRSDGSSKQWRFNDHPLYMYAGDSGPDQAHGEGIPLAGGHWHVERQEGGWAQIVGPPRLAVATVTMDQDTAWKLVTKRRSREANLRMFPAIRITGDEALGLHVLDMVAVMA